MSGGKQRRPLDTIYPLYGHEVGHEPASKSKYNQILMRSNAEQRLNAVEIVLD